MTQQRIASTEWEARRLAIEVNGSFEDTVARYEAAVPTYPAARFEQLVGDHAGWQTVLDVTDKIAEHGFLIYWKMAVDSLMSLAGNTARCTVYLMGNHTVAERMYRHNPIAMLYVPLRTVITQAPGGPTVFSTDQPSKQLSSLGNPDIAAVGLELDRKLAGLLDDLHLPVPDCLTTPSP